VADEKQETTLREDVAASFEQIEQAQTAPEVPAKKPAEAKPAERVRDDAGKFAKKDEPTNLVSPSATPAPPRPTRPSSWKKEFDPQWETLDPKLAEYIHQREREYASGVSAYKSEAENARELNNAIAPFLPNLQRFNVPVAQWLQGMGTAHEILSLGTDQQKVMKAAQLLSDYKINPQALFQVLSGQIPFQQPQQPPVDINRVLEEKLTEREIKGEFNKFLSEVEDKYPHYEAVKDTMVGLLQSGLAQDYAGAYEAAIRHPRHTDIWDAMQKQQAGHKAAEAAGQAKAQVTRARSNAVSTKSATPSGPVVTAKDNKSLRDDIASAFADVESRV